jgi:hypothetical protein
MASETTQDTPVNTQTNEYDEDIKKYTKIDNLDEDPVVENSKFFLVSFISPEGVMNCTTRGLKIRTYKNKVCFSSLEEAKQAAEEINKKDKYFNVFVGESGKWMGWDPAPDDRTKVEAEKWANADQDALMQTLREKEEKQLNELNAVVGKKKAIIDKEAKQHKKRVATAIKDSLNNQENPIDQPELVDEQTAINAQKVQEVKSHKSSSRNPAALREKLRKKLQEKKMNDPDLGKPQDTSELLKQQLDETNEQKTKLTDNIQKLNDLLAQAKAAKN